MGDEPMIVILHTPLKSGSGKVAGLRAGYHLRTNKKTGHVTMAKNGNPFARHSPTPAQLESQEQFRQRAKLPRNKAVLQTALNNPIY